MHWVNVCIENWIIFVLCSVLLAFVSNKAPSSLGSSHSRSTCVLLFPEKCTYTSLFALSALEKLIWMQFLFFFCFVFGFFDDFYITYLLFRNISISTSKFILYICVCVYVCVCMCVCIHTVVVRIIGTLGKYNQRRLWKLICIVNPFDRLFKKITKI